MSYHVVILGAGVIGCMSAVEALRQGDMVTVVEPGEPGGEQAASYGNGAWLSSHSVIPPASPGVWRKVPHYLLDPLGPLAIRPSYLPKAAPWLIRYIRSASTPAKVATIAQGLRPLLRDAPSLHAAVAREAGRPDLIDATSGLMHIYRSRAAYKDDSLAWDIRRSHGIECEELEGEALRARQPTLHPRYQFGVFVREAGHCRDPGAYVAAIAAYLHERGVKFLKTTAHGFQIEDGHLVAVVTAGGEVRCDRAVVSAGIRSKPLARAAGDSLPLETERGYHVMIEGASVGPAIPIMDAETKLVITALNGYLRAAGQVEICGVEAPPNMARAEIVKVHLLGMFSGLGDPPCEKIRFWCGNRPSTPDGKPCIGYSSASRDIVYAFGHGHIGLVTSARTGRVVAQLLHGQETEIPIGAFDPRRF